MEKLEFKVAMGAVKHFGRNLYTTNPPAIAELVANGWDAYAKQVSILTDDKSMLIVDDGIGMTDEELIERYAISGKVKDIEHIRKPDDLSDRPIMGKKGIGKFSVFSLGNEYRLATKSEGEKQFKSIKLKYDDLLGENSDREKYDVDVQYFDILPNLPDLPKAFEEKLGKINISSGTVIFIPNLRRHITQKTVNALVISLARRFAVASADYNFAVTLNGETLDLKHHFYNDNVQFVKYFGYDPDDIKLLLGNLATEPELIDDPFFSENNIKGWIGSVAKPRDLLVSADDSEGSISVSGITVYINGKLADDDILRHMRNVNMADVYIVGEVQADYLQKDVNDDPVLSSRENLDLEREDVKKLRQKISVVRDVLVSEWKKKRAQITDDNNVELQKVFAANDKIKVTYEGIPSEQKNRFKELIVNYFKTNTDEEGPSEEEIKFFAPGILSLVNTQDIYSLKVDENAGIDNQLDVISRLFDRTEMNQAIRIQASVQERLRVIEELKVAVKDEAKEKIFENHLANNPWLINPYWDGKSGDDIDQQKFFDYKLTDTQVEGFSDILVHISELAYPVIVEVKRSKKTAYSTPSASALIQQVSKYRVGLLKEAKVQFPSISLSEPKNIPAYVVVGKDAIRKWQADFEYSLFANNDIEVRTYTELISNAEKMYEKPINASY